jgi:DNA-directed RNA polymerase subunit RPC12/RpoP
VAREKLNRVIEGVALFFAIFLILLGVIFIIASGVENMAEGGAFVFIAIILLYFVYHSEKIEASKPTVVNQTFEVKMEGAGQLNEKQLRCKTCGAPLTDMNLRVVQGGVMLTCPYCGAVQALEEMPKW